MILPELPLVSQPRRPGHRSEAKRQGNARFTRGTLCFVLGKPVTPHSSLSCSIPKHTREAQSPPRPAPRAQGLRRCAAASRLRLPMCRPTALPEEAKRKPALAPWLGPVLPVAIHPLCHSTIFAECLLRARNCFRDLGYCNE